MTTDTTLTRAVVVERRVPHSLDKVWRALTQGPLLEDWLMANDFEPGWATASPSACRRCRAGTASPTARC